MKSKSERKSSVAEVCPRKKEPKRSANFQLFSSLTEKLIKKEAGSFPYTLIVTLRFYYQRLECTLQSFPPRVPVREKS